jgi:hypothetical protein
MKLSRREFMGLLGTGALSVGGLGWMPEEAYAYSKVNGLSLEEKRTIRAILFDRATALAHFEQEKLTRTIPTKPSYPYSSIAFIPDIQYFAQGLSHNSEFHANGLNKLRTWFKNNTGSSGEKVRFVMSLGDNVNNSWIPQFHAALSIYKSMGSAKKIIVPGNHDYDDGSSVINRLCEDYREFMKPLNMEISGYYDLRCPTNFYHKITLGDKAFLVLALEFLPRKSVIDWAKKVISDNSKNPIIIVTHAYQQGSGLVNKDSKDFSRKGDPEYFATGQKLEDSLVKPYDNVIGVFSGHIHNDALIKREVLRPKSKAYTFLADLQDMEKKTIFPFDANLPSIPNSAFSVAYDFAWAEYPEKRAAFMPFGMIVIMRIANATNSDGTKNAQLVYYSTTRNKYMISNGVHNITLKMP